MPSDTPPLTRLLALGYAVGLGSADTGTSFGPLYLQGLPGVTANQQLRWQDTLYAKQTTNHTEPAPHGLEAIPAIADVCGRLAEQVQAIVAAKTPFVTIGGDHTCAIGSWSGAATAKASEGPVGLIWLDAHMDSHTPVTSYTKNLHGMPLAVLLGYGDPQLTDILTNKAKILPQHLCLIGLRDYEPEEQALLHSLNVRCFFMADIQARGLADILQEALALVTAQTTGFGISLDLDAIDPEDAPGVGTPAPHGIRAADLLPALMPLVNHPALLGMDIAEFNPRHDKDNKTATLIQTLLTMLVRANQ